MYFIFRKRGKVEEREREKHQCVVASFTPPTVDLARNEAYALVQNWRPFGSQAGTQSTEPHQPRLYVRVFF